MEPVERKASVKMTTDVAGMVCFITASVSETVDPIAGDSLTQVTIDSIITVHEGQLIHPRSLEQQEFRKLTRKVADLATTIYDY